MCRKADVREMSAPAAQSNNNASTSRSNTKNDTEFGAVSPKHNAAHSEWPGKPRNSTMPTVKDTELTLAFNDLTDNDEATEEGPWQERAMCAQTDPESFYPDKGGSTREAKMICWFSCPVREQCLQTALENDEHFGIWGGYSERERRKLKRGMPINPTRLPKHGTRSSYHKGCRCAECKAADYAYRAPRRREETLKRDQQMRLGESA